MKILLVALMSVALVLNSFGAPLIYKATKKIETNSVYEELATVDVSGYKNIRVGISLVGGSESPHHIQFYALEDDTSFPMDSMILKTTNSISLTTVSNKIKISADATGTYKIYIWGAQ